MNYLRSCSSGAASASPTDGGREAKYREAYDLMRETCVELPLPWERLNESERIWFRVYADAYAAVCTPIADLERELGATGATP